jgi:hypothetical protein
MKRAAHLNSCATKLQCLYRTRTSRKYFQELKRQALKRKATLLQKHVRGFVVRVWAGRLRHRVRGVQADLLTVGHNLCRSLTSTVFLSATTVGCITASCLSL